MERQDIVRKVVTTITAVLGETNVDENLVLTENTQLFHTGLEFSSIDGVVLVVKLEQLFDIQWPAELLNFDDLLTIGEVSNIIEKCLFQKEVTTK